MNQQTRRWSLLLVLEFVLVTVAPLALGFVVGYLTGQSGPDKTVLAALLPAIITAGGLVIFSRLGPNGNHAARMAPSLCLLVFSIGLFCGAEYGDRLRKSEASEAAFNTQKTLIRLLQNCSTEEESLNRRRRQLGLEPLPTRVICGY